jgi:hypothetical protein
MTATMTAAGMPTREQALPAHGGRVVVGIDDSPGLLHRAGALPDHRGGPRLGDSPGSSRKSIPASRQASGPGRRARR